MREGVTDSGEREEAAGDDVGAITAVESLGMDSLEAFFFFLSLFHVKKPPPFFGVLIVGCFFILTESSLCQQRFGSETVRTNAKIHSPDNRCVMSPVLCHVLRSIS